MKSFFSHALLTLGVLFLLNGCAATQSWFGNVAHKDEMSPPQAAPVPPVTSVPVEQLPVAPAPAPVVGKVKVAILLPLSGKNAAIGQAMLNAAQLAVYDVAANNFELVPRDTGGSEEQVAGIAHEVTASGAQLLIGPLFAVHVPAVRQVTQIAGISMLTLSTDTSLAQPGLYVMGFAPDAQVERAIKYAAARGSRRFAALIPSSPYGAIVEQAFRMAVSQIGGVLVDLQTYDPNQRDLSAYIHALAEKREAMDTLFLPEGGSDLIQIANQLSAAGFTSQNVHVLGTGLWDAPDLGKQSSLLIGGWYAAPDPASRQRFVDVYTSTYGQAPPRLATLAYDATALAGVLAKRGAKFDQASLTNPNGFAGLDGIFRLTSRGLVERGLAILEAGSDGAHVVDPAITTFAGRN